MAFFTIDIVKQPHYKRISLHLHPVLHPITLYYIWSAVVLLRLPAYAFSLFTIVDLSTIAISDSILAKDVKRYAFKGMHFLWKLISTQLHFFLVG